MHKPVLPKYKITQEFGVTNFSKKKGKEIYYFFEGKHLGLDYHMPVGEPVCAALPGYVTSVEYHRGMGKVIRLRYGSIQHIYAHLDEFGKGFGDYVKEGEEIARSGDTVSWSGPHLHFEMRDLTVWEVKDRPIKPSFSVDVPGQFVEDFTYTVTREQALIDLALKFFGVEEGVEALRERNIKCSNRHSHDHLPAGCKIVVPFRMKRSC